MRCWPKREYWRRRAGSYGRSRSFNGDEGDTSNEGGGRGEKAAPEVCLPFEPPFPNCPFPKAISESNSLRKIRTSVKLRP